jgi:hypothetical protein
MKQNRAAEKQAERENPAVDNEAQGRWLYRSATGGATIVYNFIPHRDAASFASEYSGHFPSTPHPLEGNFHKRGFLH